MVPAEYGWATAEHSGSASYLTPIVIRCLAEIGARRVLDIGCGNGALAADLRRSGFDVEGCDPSAKGIALAREAHSGIPFHSIGVDEDPAALGRFDAVVSTEVIEHLYLPRLLPRFAARVLSPGGHLIISTPYHGYLKNLLLSLAGKWDAHLDPLWDGGHIKMWSKAKLSMLLEQEGFQVQSLTGAGRLLFLWKSMIAVARKV